MPDEKYEPSLPASSSRSFLQNSNRQIGLVENLQSVSSSRSQYLKTNRILLPLSFLSLVMGQLINCSSHNVRCKGASSKVGATSTSYKAARGGPSKVGTGSPSKAVASSKAVGVCPSRVATGVPSTAATGSKAAGGFPSKVAKGVPSKAAIGVCPSKVATGVASKAAIGVCPSKVATGVNSKVDGPRVATSQAEQLHMLYEDAYNLEVVFRQGLGKEATTVVYPLEVVDGKKKLCWQNARVSGKQMVQECLSN